MNRYIKIFISILLLSGFALIIIYLVRTFRQPSLEFDGQRAYEDVEFQVAQGPRVLGSEAHENIATWILSELRHAGWDTESQVGKQSGVPVKNLIARRGQGKPWIILGSHYDSRQYADRDPSLADRSQAVLGANDGASSVAVLLELARVLPLDMDRHIWLVFFDAEDNANISGSESSLGSQYFVSQLSVQPDRVVILDMVGDTDLNIYMELNSDPGLNQEIWAAAAGSGFAQFIPTYKYEIIDDHIPFIDAGIRAADIIDFDYPYWHTTHDTLDKISPKSLQVVGDTILSWLDQYSP